MIILFVDHEARFVLDTNNLDLSTKIKAEVINGGYEILLDNKIMYSDDRQIADFTTSLLTTYPVPSHLIARDYNTILDEVQDLYDQHLRLIFNNNLIQQSIKVKTNGSV